MGGDAFAPTHWNLPVDVKEKKILNLCLDNECCKTSINYFDMLVNFLLVPANQPEDYKKCGTIWSLFKKLHPKEPFSDEQI
jgi:hypothetical protein